MKSLVSMMVSAMLLVGCSCSVLSWTVKPVKDVVEQNLASVVSLETDTHRCSGFILSQEVIVTAGHCVHDMKTPLRVKDHNGNEFVGIPFVDDDNVDIALLSIRAGKVHLDPVELANELPKLGERIVSMGFPGYAGKRKVFEVGYVKDIILYAEENTEGPKKQPVRMLISDSIAYRGESGGPVFNEKGQVVGIVSAVAPTMDVFDVFGRHQHKDVSIIISVEELNKILFQIND